MDLLSYLENIGRFLLDISRKDDTVWIVAEALDAIFDVFAEDHINQIIQDLNMLQILSQLAPILKAKVLHTFEC